MSKAQNNLCMDKCKKLTIVKIFFCYKKSTLNYLTILDCERKNILGRIISLRMEEVPSLKIIINLPWSYEKLHCKKE